jgi:demethylmenaquinone methyltransferase / 2-methoxy-6-polyprenyl-1,4-benzoquinol methylase
MENNISDKESVAFGFRQVAAEDKQDLINEVFAQVADRYDQMNDLMSGGLHRLWKDDFTLLLNPPRGDRRFDVLDVAGGTGDVAFRILRQAGKGTRVTVVDVSPQMVEQGKARAEAAGFGARLRFTVSNAEMLGFADRQFDAYTIAFGLRNVTHIAQALSEAFRVLKPGGRFLCLEFSPVELPGLKQLYDTYSFTAIPAIGKVVTGDGKPYRYLVESIRTFPNGASLAAMIEAAGFARVQFRTLAMGIVAIHSGWRL